MSLGTEREEAALLPLIFGSTAVEKTSQMNFTRLGHAVAGTNLRHIGDRCLHMQPELFVFHFLVVKVEVHAAGDEVREVNSNENLRNAPAESEEVPQRFWRVEIHPTRTQACLTVWLPGSFSDFFKIVCIDFYSSIFFFFFFLRRYLAPGFLHRRKQDSMVGSVLDAHSGFRGKCALVFAAMVSVVLSSG